MQDREIEQKPIDMESLSVPQVNSMSIPNSIQGKVLPPAAQRALAEAEERRRLARDLPRPKEINGREGPEPTRYGDWEKNGLASDF
jgi:hypothetical protein